MRETSWQYYSRIYPPITSLKSGQTTGPAPYGGGSLRTVGGLLVRWGSLCTVGVYSYGGGSLPPRKLSRDEACLIQEGEAGRRPYNQTADRYEPCSLRTQKTCTIRRNMAMRTKIDRESPFLQKVARQRWLLPLASLFLFLGIWQLLYTLLGLPPFILPSPAMVWAKFLEVLKNGMWWHNTSYTLFELALGLFFGSVVASILGYILSKTPLLEKLFSPFLVGSQSVPVVAIAPLIIIWFGPGLFSKVLICALTVFFPVLVNVLVGMRQVSQDLRELMDSFKASKWQILRHLEIPASLPVLLGGLRVGATLSVIGAIVGELVGSDRGLGYLINLGRGQYDTALVFVAVFSLIFLAASLYSIVLFLERRALKWQTWQEI